MIDLLQPYVAIAVKLITGMIGILAFLRITGKASDLCLGRLDRLQYACPFCHAFIAIAPPYKRRECIPGQGRYHQFQEFQTQQS